MHADARARPIQGALLHVESQRVVTRHGAFCVEVLRDLAARRHLPVLVRGDVRAAQPLLAHVHVACTASECMAGCDCDCAERLDAALASMAAEGRGILFYLMQEGRGAGAWAAARSRMAVQASGGAMTDIVKLTLYVTDVQAYKANLKAIGEVYRSYFGKYFPAMTLVGVTELFDRAAMIEIEGLAVID